MGFLFLLLPPEIVPWLGVCRRTVFLLSGVDDSKSNGSSFPSNSDVFFPCNTTNSNYQIAYDTTRRQRR